MSLFGGNPMVSPEEISGENVLVTRWLRGEVEGDFRTALVTKESNL